MTHFASLLPAVPPRHSSKPVLLSDAADAFLHVPPLHSLVDRTRRGALLVAFERFLGAGLSESVPLLAYTRLTGEAWLHTLAEAERAEAAVLLTDFRAYLRDWGWLDSARPVNLLD
ncbi:hypothetical protein E7T06_06880 [Deinococcus sp. Arct2-2]|uniref:hypothetical protein n=1 Tax=Deinococcus sp. Arct2-2 TaxID=2568653 RepID=UPI0010A480EB|nr:hypothetical protein [Deinococcus sp. Arct2-2]THF70641.1 hypothetical protein E7T06_06880 [Deinococcus sp. Arct2-2]